KNQQEPVEISEKVRESRVYTTPEKYSERLKRNIASAAVYGSVSAPPRHSTAIYAAAAGSAPAVCRARSTLPDPWHRADQSSARPGLHPPARTHALDRSANAPTRSLGGHR